MAAHAAKVTDKDLVVDSSISITLVDAKALKAKKKSLGRAATFQKFEKLVDTMTEASSNPKGSKAVSSPSSSNLGSPQDGVDSYLKNGIPTALLTTGIPVEALLQMLQNNTELANESYELYSSTNLAQAGYTKGDDGTYTLTGESLANTEAQFTIDAGTADAASIRSDGIEAISSGMLSFGSEIVSHVGKGSVSDAEDDVAKVENALEFERNVPHATNSLTDLEAPTATAKQREKGRNIRAALARLEGGSFDVTKDDCAIGTSAIAQRKGRKTVYRYEKNLTADKEIVVRKDPTNENEIKVSAREALTFASDKQRTAIKKSLEKRLATAKEELRTRTKRMYEKKQAISQRADSASQALSKGMVFNKAAQSAQSATSQAQKSLIQSENQTMQGVQKAQNDNIDAAKKNAQTTQDLLAQMMAQVGKRG